MIALGALNVEGIIDANPCPTETNRALKTDAVSWHRAELFSLGALEIFTSTPHVRTLCTLCTLHLSGCAETVKPSLQSEKGATSKLFFCCRTALAPCIPQSGGDDPPLPFLHSSDAEDRSGAMTAGNDMISGHLLCPVALGRTHSEAFHRYEPRSWQTDRRAYSVTAKQLLQKGLVSLVSSDDLPDSWESGSEWKECRFVAP